MKSESVNAHAWVWDFVRKLFCGGIAVLVVAVLFLPRDIYAVEEESGTWPGHLQLWDTDPIYRDNFIAAEKAVEEYVAAVEWLGAAGMEAGLAIIPVVVHVVHTNPNIVSDAQINTKIGILNEDYRAANTDKSLVASCFTSLIADARIEFQLAVRDPDCNPTNGITRTTTTVQSFPMGGDPVKSAASGGHDPWPRDKYLNIWVCNGSGYMGYARFPGCAAAIDGVVIDHETFGTTATASGGTLGRSTTHEIGHWLNLRHIWGDDGTACTGTDYVADTPNQAGSTPKTSSGACPSWPQTSCSNGPNGDLFYNHMDYTNHGCRVMFTTGQVTRMHGTLFTTRSAILGSDGLIPPPPTAGPADVWSQDRPDDPGAEPNVTSSPMYRSEDIWVRNQNDGLTNHEHQDPQYRDPSLGQPNYVYVRVRNTHCSTAGSGMVKLYWAKAGLGLSWPAPWDGSVTTYSADVGGQIAPLAGQSTGSVPGGGFTILEFEWYPPDPDDYATITPGEPHHFCLLSRIETSTTSPYGMTFPEGSNLTTNVQNNNNIVWKNVHVLSDLGAGGETAQVFVWNLSDEERLTRWVFGLPDDFVQREWGQLFVDLGEKLFHKWQEGGAVGTGVWPAGGNRIEVAGTGAWIGGVTLEPQEMHAIVLEFVPRERPARESKIFEVLVEQYVSVDGVTYEHDGGMVFLLKDMYRPPTPAVTMMGNTLTLNWLSFGTGSFTVQWTSNLATGPWKEVEGQWPTTEAKWSGAVPDETRFYRVISGDVR